MTHLDQHNAKASQNAFEADVRKWIRQELGELETDCIDW